MTNKYDDVPVAMAEPVGTEHINKEQLQLPRNENKPISDSQLQRLVEQGYTTG